MIRFDGVWLDDRQRGRWAPRGVDLTIQPATLVAVVNPTDDGGADAILDLVAGRRLPVEGTVDLGSQGGSVVEAYGEVGGERCLCREDATLLVARPLPETLARADHVIVVADGLITRMLATATP
ncbi:MAG: hypothetical protein M3Q68_02435 [Actinomycetota bacterium]|nr:hypothetical protein [Actinomycetota bacterium]